MAQPYDLPLEQLKAYKPALTRKPDFKTFWEETSARMKTVPVTYDLTPYDYPVRGVSVYRITYPGFEHSTIQGWLAVPDSDGPLPGIVSYHGYNYAMDGNLHDTVQLSLHGYAVLHMLCRGQQGGSVDNTVTSHGNTAGWMTKGILSKEEYYYRAVYMDAVRAVEVLASMDKVDAERIGVTGGSQGGALSVAAAALSPLVKVAVADFPYLAHFERAIDMAPTGPYLEINDYFRKNPDPKIEEQAKETLSYFDVMNLAPEINCHVRINIGLVDDITPPSTVFAVYNHLNASKDLGIYRYFGHEFIPGAVEPKLRTLMNALLK